MTIITSFETYLFTMTKSSIITNDPLKITMTTLSLFTSSNSILEQGLKVSGVAQQQVPPHGPHTMQ